jgi:hypothetical protein
MRLAVTGPVWDAGDLSRIREDPTVSSFDKHDFLIILGDCGVTAPRRPFREILEDYRKLPCTVLFLDGARDDYDLLADHPSYPWNGGLAQTLTRSVMRLCRGQVFMICGMKILTMGGSTTEGRDDVGKYWDWWPEQDPSQDDVGTAVLNLGEWGGVADVVLTADCPSSWRESVGKEGVTPASEMLEQLKDRVDYKRWLFGGTDTPRDISGCNASAVGRTVVRLA